MSSYLMLFFEKKNQLFITQDMVVDYGTYNIATYIAKKKKKKNEEEKKN